MKQSHNRFSYFKFLFEITLFLWVYYLLFTNIHNTGVTCYICIIPFFFIWILFSLVTHKFQEFDYSKNFWISLAPYIKFYFLYISFSLIIYFVIKEFVLLTNKDFIFTTILYVFWSLCLETILYFNNKPIDSDEINHRLIKATTYPEIEQLKNINGNYFFNEVNNKQNDEFYYDLKHKFLKDYEELFTFLEKNLNLRAFSKENSLVIRSADPYNIRVLKEDSIQLFINLHELNDIRRINAYMIELNKKLIHHGVYIGKFEPIRFRYKRFLAKYPKTVAKIFYFYDFLWKRVAPKLPLIQKFYFAVTRGRDRAISLAEGLGRLYFSGYKVLSLKTINNFIFFIAVKVKEPSSDENPSYGPFFKMKRIGKEGKIIYVYKLRTMHPYSEYLQDYILENFGYNEVGKPANDFRVTKWGKFFRKIWIDELPQLINVIKGEMKLVGVRPLSLSRYNELPDNVKKERVKYKPGCIPPYVSLNMPDAFGNIEAEKIYINEKKKHPVWTDIKYFFLAIYNILTNKIRSA